MKQPEDVQLSHEEGEALIERLRFVRRFAIQVGISQSCSNLCLLGLEVSN